MQHGDSAGKANEDAGQHAEYGNDPINRVQRAEEEAAKTVDAAKEAKEKALIEAKRKSDDIVEKATDSAKEKRQKELNDAEKKLEKEKELALAKAEKDAREIRAKKLGAESRERIFKELVSLILGA
jgi:vacuolar-type H+-ATPase subunit H